MIRVLHVLGGLERGGAETMVMNLYRAIDRTQIQFDFIIHTNEHQAYYDEICSLGGKIYSFPKYNGRNHLFMKKKWGEFFLNHPEYRILHSHVRSYASLYIPIAKKHGLKTIIHSHSTSNGRGVKSIVKKLMQYPLRNQADFFMGCSKEAGKWLFGNKIVNNNNFIIIKNAIDISKYTFNPKIREKYRDILNLNNSYVYIHVGRFHPVKDHDFLLKLFCEIHKESTNSKLILVGDGYLRSHIEKMIQELSMSSSVILVGSQPNVYDYLQAADCFLFTSKWEGLGMAAVEAQASGLKCICNTGIPKDVKVTDLCYFIPTTDLEKWKKEALNMDYFREDTSQLIKNSGFDINDSALKLFDFYKGVLNG